MQLDLFNDSRDVILQNGVIAALRERDSLLCRQALNVLAAEYPEHENLEAMRILLATLDSTWRAGMSRDEIAKQIHSMETVFAPAARQVLGERDCAEWLAPLWRTLAECAEALAYSPNAPKTHAAFLLLQCGDFAQAEAAAASVASWRRIPFALSCMADARFHLGGLESAWPLLLELAWIDPCGFGPLSQRLRSPALNRLLQAFDAFCEADEPDYAWFPAWMLTTMPGMADVLRRTQVCIGHVQERVARLIVELLSLERQGRHHDIVTRRKTLRDQNPALYALYMSTR